MTRTPLRFLFLAPISALALAACQEAAPPPAAAPEAEVVLVQDEPVTETTSRLPMMACGAEGGISQDTTRETLAATYGAENLAEEELSWVDSTETALVLFPNDPSTRVELFWLDKTSGGPRHVRVQGEESQWIGPAGLFAGASLADVEAANGGPFEMMGFQNHNEGEVTSWLGGALAAKPGETCELGMVMGLPADLPESVVSAVSGDPEKVYRSDSPEIVAANPAVYGLALDYFDPS